jgi:hypothetical protein
VLESPFCCAASRSLKPVAGGRSDCLRSVGCLFPYVVWLRLRSARVSGPGPSLSSFGSGASGWPGRGPGKLRYSSGGIWGGWAS